MTPNTLSQDDVAEILESIVKMLNKFVKLELLISCGDSTSIHMMHHQCTAPDTNIEEQRCQVAAYFPFVSCSVPSKRVTIANSYRPPSIGNMVYCNTKSTTMALTFRVRTSKTYERLTVCLTQ